MLNHSAVCPVALRLIFIASSQLELERVKVMGKPENIENADKQSMDGTRSSGIHTTLLGRLRVRTQNRDAKIS